MPFNDPTRILTTERLILREIRAADAPFLVELMNSPDWIKNIGDRNVYTETDALLYMETQIFPEYGRQLGPYIIETKQEQIRVGTCGIHIRDFLPNPDIGYALLAEFFGNGYAYEASYALLEYGRREWAITDVYGMVLPENSASIHLLKKLGLHFKDTLHIPNDPELLHLYSSSSLGEK